MSGRRATRMEMVAIERILWGAPGWDANLARRRADGSPLERSVAELGVIEPVTLEEQGSALRVVAGFRRVAAARARGAGQVAAVVYGEGALSPREAFMLALATNAPGAALSDADRIAALAKARRELGFTDEEAAESVAPLLGLPRSLRVAREYLALSELPERVLAALDAGEKSREHASALLLVAPEDREDFFAGYVERLRLSASETRLVASAALDLAARAGEPFGGYLAETFAAALAGGRGDGEEGAPARQKALLKSELARRLSPAIARMEERFAALARELRLPEGASVEHSANFELDEVTLHAQARDAATFEKVREALERGVEAGVFDRMLALARESFDVSRADGGDREERGDA